MTWVYHIGYSGASEDNESEKCGAAFLNRSVEAQSARGRTGSWGVKLNHTGGNAWTFGTQGDANDKTAEVRTPPPSGSRVLAVQAGVGLAAAPSVDSQLFHWALSTVNGKAGIQILASRALQFRDSTGLVGSASTTLIPTTGLIDVVAFWFKDDSGNWWASLYMDGAEEIEAFKLPGGSAFSASGGGGSDTPQVGGWGHNSLITCETFIDDACTAHSLAAGDAPWTTKYPFVRMKGGISDMPPKADGATVDWNKGAGGWSEIDDTGGNDGGATFNQETEENKIHLHQWTATNPIPSGATVRGVQFRTVSAETGDGKNAGNMYIEKGATPDTETGPLFSNSANYRGKGWIGVPDPEGDYQSWEQGDFDPGDWDFGFKAASVDAGHRLTLMGGPLVLYTETADLIILLTEPEFDTVIPKAASDTLGLDAAEASAVQAGLTAADTLALSVAEAITVQAHLVASDNVAMATVESVGLFVTQPASDTLGLAVTESVEVEAQFSATDALTLDIVEAASAVAVVLSASDSVALTLTETTVTQANAAGVDTIALATDEGVPDALVIVAVTDTVGLATDEASAATAIFAASDALSLAATEGATAVAVVLTSSDTVALALTESVVSVEVSLSGTDDLGLAITEQNALLALVSGSDAVALATTEATLTEVLLGVSDTLGLAITETTALAAVLTASDTVALALTDASTAPVVEAILGERDLPDILDDIRDCLLLTPGIRDVDSFWPTNLGALPRVILRYLDSPWELQLQRTEIHHEIEAEIVIAPASDAIRAQRKVAGLVNDVKAQLLPSDCVGFSVVSVGSTGMRQVSYHGRRYWAATVRIRAVETAGATV